MLATGQALCLIVDDDEMLRVMTRAALEAAGFVVEELANGDNLATDFRRLRPDLVLLDVLMPGLDGFAACAQLRADPLGAHVPILMMTGLDDVESINRSYEVGATDFVTKPIGFNLLGHRLRYMLRAQATAEALRASEARLAMAQRIARLGHWEAAASGRFTPWAQETYDVLGLPHGVQIEGLQQLAQLAIDGDRERVAVTFSEAIDLGRAFELEFRMTGITGEVRNIYMVAMTDVMFDASPSFVGTVQDITARRRAEQQIHQLANVDAVTGLPNRASLRTRLVQALALAKRNTRELAVLCLDLDHFQRINDTLGFASGNALLYAVGERFRAVLRASDSFSQLADTLTLETVGRAAGDEFIVILPEIASAEDAAAVARRLRAALGEPFSVADQEIHVRTSIGISVFPEDGTSADDLLKHADSALAQAKREGRDCYQFFTAALNARAFKRLTMEMHLRRALDREQFQVYFQPKLRASDLAVVGFEALVRWLHPELGRVSPAEFIPIAEETGLIVPIGEWVLASAARQMVAWQQAGRAVMKCAVNLSAMQFRAKDLHQRLAQVVADCGLPPCHIDLELTESVLMEDGQAAIRTLHELKAHGFGIAVDDFGTGYSSLSYLKRLPIDILKIDQSFVHELQNGSEDAAIVSTIISMARSLRLKVVAEGVEQQAQMDFLRAEGCDELQGFLFSPPLPADQIALWVDQHVAPGRRRGVAVSV